MTSLLFVGSVTAYFLSHRARDLNDSPPALTCAEQIDLGEQFFNDTVFANFVVSNVGGSPLEVSHFGTSCSCAGVETTQDGVAKRVTSLTLPPGGSCDLSAKLSVSAEVGMPQVVTVQFRTNDPNRPVHELRSIVSKVKGGLYFAPRSILFGSLAPSAVATRRILLYENGVFGASVTRVRSSAPDHFRAKLVPLLPEERLTSQDPAGLPFAAVEVEAITDRAGPLAGEVRIDISGERVGSSAIPVTGTVRSYVTVSPVALFMPSGEAGATQVVSDELTLTGNDDGEYTVSPEVLPEGTSLTVRRIAAGKYGVRVARPRDANRAELCVRVTRADARSELVYFTVFPARQ